MSVADQLDPMTRSFLNAALWASGDESEPGLDRNHSIEDIDREAVKRASADCFVFRYRNHDLFLGFRDEMLPMLGTEAMVLDRLGHEFLMDRNSAGSGFWDMFELSESLRGRLSAAAKQFLPFELYLGDDGKIYHYG